MGNLEPAQLSPDEQQRSGWAAAGLGVGFVGVLLAFIPLMYGAAFIICIFGLILSLIAYNKQRQGRIGMLVGCVGLFVASMVQLL